MGEATRDGVFEQIAEAARRAQATSLANRLVLREIRRELAGSRRVRHADLADTFERIGACADRLPIAAGSDPAIVGGMFREELAKFFVEVAGIRSARDDDEG
jgi:hypothetical protein